MDRSETFLGQSGRDSGMNEKRVLAVFLSLIVVFGIGTVGAVGGTAPDTQDGSVHAGGGVNIADLGTPLTLLVGSLPVLVGLVVLAGLVLVGLVLVAYWRRPKLTFSVDNPRGREVELTIESDVELDEFVVKIAGPESTLIYANQFAHSEDERHHYTATYVGNSDGRYAGTLTVGSTTPREGERTYRDSVGVTSPSENASE